MPPAARRCPRRWRRARPASARRTRWSVGAGSGAAATGCAADVARPRPGRSGRCRSPQPLPDGSGKSRVAGVGLLSAILPCRTVVHRRGVTAAGVRSDCHDGAIAFIENYRQLFGCPAVARAVAAAFVARLRDGGTPLAMVLTVGHGTGSFTLAGLATGAFGLAAALSRPAHGWLLDRRGQRVLLFTAAGNSLALLGLVAVVQVAAPTPVILLVAAVVGLTLPAQAAALRALLPGLTDRRLRPAAYAVEANAQELTAIVGPLVVSVLVALVSPGGALAALAVIGVVGTGWYAAAPAVGRWRGGTDRPRHATTPRSSAIWTLMFVVASISVVLGVLQVVVPAFAEERGVAHLSGVSLAAFATGSLLGGAIYGAGRWRRSSVRQLRLLLPAIALGVGMLALADGVVMLSALAVVAGLAMAPAFAVTFLLCDEVAPPGRAVQSFTWLGAANTAGFGAGGALAGVLVERTGTSATFVFAAAVVVTGAVVLWTRPGLVPPARP
ncbi:MFS transporter [Micromonospora sp. NPDC002389]|uniref:MFS transporter n=1 Tax=Micromonospora sp. NPDC002389 TaxID=3154272 RepID=UPI00331B3EA3